MAIDLRALHQPRPAHLPALPEFGPGDTVRVQARVVEGDRERLQPFEGVVIRVKNGPAGNFTVRRIGAHSVGVERTFFTHSPRIEKVEIVRRAVVARAKLYYLRGLTQVGAGAAHVELPAVVHAAQAVFLVAAVEHGGAAVRAVRIHQAGAAAAVLEQDQLLTQHFHPYRIAVGARHFLGQRHRQPEPPEQIAHRGARAGATDQFVLFTREHRAVSSVLFR